MTSTIETKLSAGGYKYPAKIEYKNNKIYFYFGYKPKLLEEIKAMDGAKYHGYDEVNPIKCWSVSDNQRNRFQLAYLMGQNPYARYDLPLVDCPVTSRYNYAKNIEITLYNHQQDMVSFVLTRHYCEIAGEMGVGKTLAMIVAMEVSDHEDWWYVAPNSALLAVDLEFKIWKMKFRPRMMTYESLRGIMKNWPKDKKAPRGVIFDECSRVKTPTAQRSQAAKALADGIREDWGEDGYVIEMSGTPAPKSPADWWFQCEIACPGFLKEGNYQKFKQRLGLIVMKDNLVTGGVYPHLVSWRDNENKCDICGEFAEHPNHDPAGAVLDAIKFHPYKQSINEVARLYKRMQGLVLVKRKKDCLDLPEKIPVIIKTPPTDEILRAAQIIKSKSSTTIKALTLLRELSDGFQYKDKVIGAKICEQCFGKKKTLQWISTEDQILDPANIPLEVWQQMLDDKIIRQEMLDCERCGGSGEEDLIERETVHIACPKEDVLIDTLEEHEDISRMVVYAGFEGSIDRCVSTAQKCEWNVIRMDGRGVTLFGLKDKPLVGVPLELFQLSAVERICFVGHPESGGMGLTLTRSPTTLFYSNDFKAENRMQAVDRIHRPGMDLNRGATIIDIIHLPTDQQILDNLEKKKKLQDMSLGEIDINYTGERQL